MTKLLILLLILATVPAVAVSEEVDTRICAPFQGGIVDPAIINTMLEAANDHRLYRIRPKQSEIGFCVESAIGRIEAYSSGVQGGMALDRQVWGDKTQILVMVDAASLAAESPFVMDLLHSESFLDTETYSKILFVSTRLHWIDHRNAILRGMLTLHGVTRPVSFSITMDFLPNFEQDSVGDIVVTAKTFIDRCAFGMDRLGFLVSDEVELCMRITVSLFSMHGHG